MRVYRPDTASPKLKKALGEAFGDSGRLERDPDTGVLRYVKTDNVKPENTKRDEQLAELRELIAKTHADPETEWSESNMKQRESLEGFVQKVEACGPNGWDHNTQGPADA